MRSCIILFSLLIILSICATGALAKIKAEVKITIINEENNKQKNANEHDPETIPEGMLLFFNRPQCPAGWNEVASSHGRYLVALPANGTSGGIVGTPLLDQENRPNGQHAHSISDPGHTHSRYKNINGTPNMGHHPMSSWLSVATESYQTSTNTTGITINNAGSIIGTNAPYAQLLLCKYTGTFVSPQSEFPPGSVMYFNSANCPAGWGDLTALRGRYAVGLSSGGFLGVAVGTALIDQENRPVGKHTHNINDPGHFHSDYKYYTITNPPFPNCNGNFFYCSYQHACTTSTTGVTIQDAGSTEGTNAPYIQLLACMPIISSAAPGKVLNSLMLTKSGSNPILNWEPVGGTCTSTGYGIYRGALPFSNYDHASLDCTISATTYTDALASDSYYYLVVPNNSSEEGSYGTDSSGTERPQGSSPCRIQNLHTCD